MGEDPRRRLVADLPDTPRYVETRGMLLSGRGELVGWSEGDVGFLAYDPVLCIASVVGEPSEAAWEALAADERPRRSVLVQTDGLGAAAPRLSFSRLYEAVLHLPPERPLAPRPDDAPCRDLDGSDLAAPEGWPEDQWRDVARALEAGLPAAAALADGAVASVCYACYLTETLWDVSIDTAPGHRRRGLAAAAVRHLAARLAPQGVAPCWGADVANAPSLALAAHLGFRPAERFFVFER